MNCTGQSNCGCGCCAGPGVVTPQAEDNQPGLSSIAYRAGTWATFKETMQARLSSSDFPALAGLKTRADDDFCLALIDAGALVLDILTFYTERLANESYLRTAGQLRSLIELSRLIGYQPAPGTAASTYVAFTLKAAPGLPANPASAAITIPHGTQIQSVPAQGQTPQTFETAADIQAKADWNALAVQTSLPWSPGVAGANVIYFVGTTTQLQPGDALLILGVARDNWSPSDPSDIAAPSDWDVIVIRAVSTVNTRNLTKVTYQHPFEHQLGDPESSWPSGTTAKVFAFRQRANFFGYSAPNPKLFVSAQDPKKTSLPTLIDENFIWRGYYINDSDHYDLDTTYPKIVAGGWFALTLGGEFGETPASQEFGFAQLFRVNRVSADSRNDFGLSGKVTRLAADFSDPDLGTGDDIFDLKHTSVLAQTEELEVADQPLDAPLYGTSLDLQALGPDLLGARVIAVTGKRQKLIVRNPLGLDFTPADGSPTAHLNPAAVVTLLDPAPLPLNPDGTIPKLSDWFSNPGNLDFNVADASGRPGTITASLFDLAPALAAAQDPTVSECVVVSSVSNAAAVDPLARPHTVMQLQTNLVNCYDRTTATVNANVALATHGQSVSEILGNGSAAIPNQAFTLRQSPLTFTQAQTPSGRQTTLEVRANADVWEEVDSLYNRAPSERAYATRHQLGKTTIRFGDGVEGATLPTGQNNVHAHYRVGLGKAGNVATDALTTLMDRPLGVTGATNPQPATGGQDADSIDDTRSNAPKTVLTLGLAVSITDYRDFAATFSGISKAHAIWIPSGLGRSVFLTVSGVWGAALPEGNSTLAQLVTSLREYGHPLIPITAKSFVETLFGLIAQIAYDKAYDSKAVEADVRQSLTQTYSFANRSYGQGIFADEVTAVIQSVAGVVAVNVVGIGVLMSSTAGDLAGLSGGFSVSNLNRWMSATVTVPRPHSESSSRICAYLTVPSRDAIPTPAEILVLHPDPRKVLLGVMS